MAKADQVGFFDKHAEKIAVAVALLVFLVIFFFKVISSPNATSELDPNRKLSPKQMDEELQKEAERVRNAINARQPKAQEISDPLQQLQAVMAEPLRMPVGEIVPPIAPWAVRQLKEGPKTSKTVVDMPAPPAPSKALVWAGRELVQSEQGLEQVAVAHITAVLDYAKMVNQWKPIITESGSAMKILFVDVVAERQKLTDDGWGETETLAGNSPIELSLDNSDMETVGQMLNQLGGQGVQRAILHPSYDQVYWPRAGAWGGWMHHLPKTLVSDLPDAQIWEQWVDQQQAEPIRLQMEADKKSSLADRDDDAPKRNNAAPTTTMPDMTMPDMTAPMTIPGGGAPATTTRRPTGGRTRQTNTNDDKALNAKRAAQMVSRANEAMEEGRQLLKDGDADQAAARFKEAEGLFTRAMDVDSSVAGAREGLAEAVRARFSAELPQPVSLPTLAQMCRAGKVQFWYHDTTCEKSTVYRYRLKLSVVNPVFDASMIGRKDAPQPIFEVVSPWSDKVSIEDGIDFYLTGTDRSGNAKISIFKEVRGLLMMQKATVAIGDAVGTIESRSYVDPITGTVPVDPIDVDFSTGYVVVDINTEKSVFPTGASGVSGSDKKTDQIILLAPDGKLVSRTTRSDRKNSDYSEKSQLNKNDEDYLEDLSSGTLR